jgi:energy-coupling factor transporter ATP-binding protein EcfA2
MYKDIFQTENIDLEEEHLKRDSLLDQLCTFVSESQFVLLTSPAASGKSSLLKLYQERVKDTSDVIWPITEEFDYCGEFEEEDGCWCDDDETCHICADDRTDEVFELIVDQLTAPPRRRWLWRRRKDAA